MEETDIVMPDLNGGNSARTLTERPYLKYRFISGDTGNVITGHSELGSVVPFTNELFSKKNSAEKKPNKKRWSQRRNG